MSAPDRVSFLLAMAALANVDASCTSAERGAIAGLAAALQTLGAERVTLLLADAADLAMSSGPLVSESESEAFAWTDTLCRELSDRLSSLAGR